MHLTYKKRLVIPPVLLLLFLLIISTNAFAGVSGKISGVVSDFETGEPIEGATIKVQGTVLSTLTDIDGEYFIINLPSGKYNVAISYVGYESVIKQDVRVLVDLTTPVDFDVNRTTIVLENEIVVNAVNPIIQKDLTSSKITFTSDDLKSLPNIITIQSVLTKYPGVVLDADRNLHVRGGRSGQVVYQYDGYSVQDPFVSNSGIRIIPSTLEELSLTSGGFTAEYGEAMSGIVNAISRIGGSEYHGGVKAYQGFTHKYDINQGDWKDLDYYSNRSGSFFLSGPLPGADPKKNSFFTAGEYLRDPTYLPNNWGISYVGTAKINMQPISNMKFSTNVTYNTSNGRIYEHRDVNGRSYDFNLDGLPAFEREAYLVGFTGNYNFNESMIFSLVGNTFYTQTKSAPPQYIDVDWSQWAGYSEDDDGIYNGTIHEDNYGNDRDFTDPMEVAGFTTGDDFDPTFRYRKTRYTSIKSSLVNQINKFHQFKTGVEYRQYDIDWNQKQFYNANPYGEKYHTSPVLGSAFIQDKMEFDYFVVNIGLRFDYRDADIAYNTSPGDTVKTYQRSSSKSEISPRLGISFPISEKTMMHFNYGVYYQEPSYTFLYTNLEGDISSGLPLLGNPDLNPEQTSAYEIGLDHLIGESVKLDVTAYYKDIKDLVTTRSLMQVAGNSVTFFTNDDYGNVKGFDVALHKLADNSFLGGSISYSYMIAEGNGSYSLEPYYTYLTSSEDTLAPLSKYPLDFDQRHTLTATMALEIPQDWSANLYGINVPSAWGLSLVGNYGSGLPYTKTDISGNRLGDRNESRLPSYYTVDMKFHKDFFMHNNSKYFSFFVEVDNLFDKRNVLSVYSRTGQPDDDGNVIGAGLSLDENDVNFYDELFDNDPQNFSAPRTIRTGLEFNF
ncbi:MAG: TonB-dependent receptor [candidate division Zixibacteria bacterium]|nr:TonB-dependent receptor [candidate division Zixibacteria bacterium]